MNRSEEILSYLRENPISRTQPDPYGQAANKFGVSTEVIRCQWRKLRRTGIEGIDVIIEHPKQSRESALPPASFKRKGNEATLTQSTVKAVRNEQELAEACEIDLDKWEIKEWECKRYESWIKKDGSIYAEPRYSVWVKLKLRTAETDLVIQKELILKELKEYSPKAGNLYKSLSKSKSKNKSLLLEIGIPDLHLGSLVWHEETGENYDIAIAESRFKEAIYTLLRRVTLDSVERILLPIGNDLLNVDSKNNATSNGTVVDTDCRFMKIVKAAKRILIETIDELSLIAPVDVVIVPGNHDYTSSLMIGEILEAFYHNNKRVNIDNSLKSRKYYQFGQVGIAYTHGDEEKHADLALLFAAEQPHLWADTKYRFIHLGHYHKNKKINYLSKDEFHGVQVQILPTLSSATAWAYKKGYMSMKQAKAFLYERAEGQVGEVTYTV